MSIDDVDADKGLFVARSIMIPQNPSDLGLDVPGDEWRDQQRYAITHALDTFLNRNLKFWFLNGPPGVGKSVIAAAVGRLLQVRTLFLTHTIQLQEQYVQKTMKDAATATGKRNHPCLEAVLPGWTAEDCGQCKQATPEGCSYWQQMFKALDANELVLNYAYATRVLQGNHMKPLCEGAEGMCSGCNPFRQDVKLLVCDEGHLAHDAIVSAAQVSLNKRSFEAEGFTLPETNNLGTWIDWAQVSGSKARGTLKAAVEARNLPRLRRCRMIVERLATLARMDEDDEEIVVSVTERGAEVQPLWGWDYAQDMLMKKFERVILMSATLGDPEVLSRKLSIDEREYAYADLSSPFPVENRRVWRWPVVKVNARTPDAEMQHLVAAADAVIDKFPQRKGIVHSVSHKLAQYFYANSRHQERLLVHDARDKMVALERYTSSLQPLVLVTASFTTGLDLPGMIGFQVLLKVPFGNLGDEVTRWRMEWGEGDDRFGKKNYQAEAMNTVVQACGRGVRTPTDVCHTFILDSNFGYLSKTAWMPRSFEESLAWAVGRR